MATRNPVDICANTLHALAHVITETEQRRSEQLRLMAELAGSPHALTTAKRVLTEIEKTLGVSRAYLSILRRLSGVR